MYIRHTVSIGLLKGRNYGPYMYMICVMYFLLLLYNGMPLAHTLNILLHYTVLHIIVCNTYIIHNIDSPISTYIHTI